MRNVCLVGLPGSGKTTCGRILASTLRRPFMDTDEWVSKETDMSIADVFLKLGEQEFRKLEQRALLEAIAIDEAVISCGGGAILDAGNVERMKENGKIVYLDVSPELASSRILPDSSNVRPLIKGDPAGAVRSLHEQRGALYREAADLIVDASGTAAATAKRIIELL